jgi:HAMP domain-containing protein
MRDLRGLRLLIVEDEWMLAEDLARYFSKMGAHILGPAATVEQAAVHADAAEAAILDVNLNGRRVFPIADKLMRRSVPFVFFSGDSEIAIPEHLRYVSNLRKTSGSQALVDALFPEEQASLPDPSDDVLSIVPKLRLAARLLLADVDASDRLVERTLERAIRDIDRRRASVSTEDWINEILQDMARSHGASLLH